MNCFYTSKVKKLISNTQSDENKGKASVKVFYEKNDQTCLSMSKIIIFIKRSNSVTFWEKIPSHPPFLQVPPLFVQILSLDGPL